MLYTHKLIQSSHQTYEIGTVTIFISENRSVMSDSLWPHGLYNPWNSPGQKEWVAFPFSRGSSQPRDGTQISHIAGAFFTSWAIREAQEYWVGSLFLLQWVFPTQELNQGLLHCRRIIYQLSYQGSPDSYLIALIIIFILHTYIH